jgi:hypothetical protein
VNFPKKSGDDDQLERFKALARQLGCDEDKGRFEQRLAKLATAKKRPKKKKARSR